MNILRKIIGKTKEPLSYISDLSQVIFVAWTLFSSIVLLINNTLTASLRDRLQALDPMFKTTLILFLIYMFSYYVNRIYKQLKFIFESNKLSSNLEAEQINQTTGQLIKNYKNIIPSTFVLREIYKEFENRAKKWATDSYLADFSLVIWVKRNEISMSVKVEFFSKRKQASLSFGTLGMKVPNERSITPDQLSYDDFRVPMMPIFLDRKWRKFVVECLERIENTIAGHEFYLNVGSWLREIIRFYLDPGFKPQRTFTFYLKNGVMYRDSLCLPKDKIVTL